MPERLHLLLRQGPPEEESYVPPGVPKGTDLDLTPRQQQGGALMWVRRRRWTTVGAAAALVVLLGTVLATSWTLRGPAASTPTTAATSAILPFPSVGADAATSVGILRPGDVAVIADAKGPALLVRVRAVRELASVPGHVPTSDGDVFLDATVDLDVLRDVSGLSLAWKAIGAQGVASATWPPNRLDLRELTPGVHSGELGFEAPAVGQILWRILNTDPSGSPQFQLRAAQDGSLAATGSSPRPGDWTSLSWGAPVMLPVPIGGAALPDSVAAWRGAYVVVGSMQEASGTTAAAAWRSTDGATWQQTFVDDPGQGHSNMLDVHVVAGVLVAVGTSGVDNCSAPGEGQTCDPLPVAIWTSADGRSWHRVTTPTSFDGAVVSDIAAGPGGLLLVGDTGWDQPRIWSSPNGIQWMRERMPANVFVGAHFQKVAAVGAGWVLVGSVGGGQSACCVNSGPTGGPAAWYSEDGETWVRAGARAPTTGRGALTTLSVGSGGLVAMEDIGGGAGGTIRWTSTDGKSWTNTPWSFDANQPNRPLASDGTRIVWAGWTRSGPLPLFVSADGVAWRQLAATGDTNHAPSTDASAGAQLVNLLLEPDGLIAIGLDGTSARALVWVAHALSAP